MADGGKRKEGITMALFTKIYSRYFRNQLYVNGERQLVPSWAVDKLAVDRFCAESGIPHAKTYRIWDSPNEINFDGLPSNFVVKPSNLNSSRGVHVLERQSAEVYTDHYMGEDVTVASIRASQAHQLELIREKEPHRLRRYRILAQERMVDWDGKSSAVTDFKFWMVGKKLKYIRVNGGGHYTKIPICFYDEHFEPLPEVNERIYLKKDAVPIAHRVLTASEKGAMIRLAERVADLLDENFVRLDLYLTVDGPKLGEITPAPGSPYNGHYFGFTEHYDDAMGKEWARALGLDIAEVESWA